jgi:regulatory protein YycH of two-component signal transduction system YycFG
MILSIPNKINTSTTNQIQNGITKDLWHQKDLQTLSGLVDLMKDHHQSFEGMIGKNSMLVSFSDIIPILSIYHGRIILSLANM